MQWSFLAFGGGLLRLAFFLFRQTPAACPAAEAFLLLLCRDRRCIFEAKDLIHRLTGIDIVAGKPPLTIKRAGILMFAPTDAFGWIRLNTACIVA